MLRFFLLVIGLSIPFWIWSARRDLELAPGLPVAALMALCPGIAAAMLSYHEQGRVGVARLLGRSFDLRRIPKIWYVPILLLVPALSVVSYALLRLSGARLPPQDPSLAGSVALLLGFFPFALAEELGWTGYATDRLQQCWTRIGAALLLGVFWAAWHLVPLTEAHRSADWIAGWALGTVANRVILFWIYDNTGSVFGAALYHTSLNLSWQLFPSRGSHYDPRVTGVLLACTAGLVSRFIRDR